MKHYIYKGNRPSEGAVQLKNALDGVLMKSEGSSYRGRQGTCVINWGTINAEAQRLEALAPIFLNSVNAVKLASNKLSFFRRMQEVLPEHTVPFAETLEAAENMLNAGGRIFARTVLNGHSGSGIVLMCNAREAEIQAIAKVRRNNLMPVIVYGQDVMDPVRNCTLFTQGITGKRTEFRVHVVRGRVILTQAKLRREGHADNPNSNTIVRNVDSGWVYGVNNVEEQVGVEAVRAAAIRAVEAVGLDFGAVDLVYKEDNQTAYVLEINTAPGLAEEGSAVAAYSEAFKELFV
ncbi:ribosomal protein S6 glutaminyl transferase [Pseudomonas phage tf]|jgi:glutathione synthase/RimK-type ligase-like ATP-grasp enzyme|uniref:ATP-grasp enzyme n=1 Tax=Pseudomonas phage tf TaxID=1114179 RepID=I2FLP7_9CAUD|nr:ribosomal protein S6 glutaminyl transferase [Pseudomonas phage tf]CCE60781.1 hypothetical protein tf_24 [Pseudomonas phage tf]